jgi:hypothetical protein
MRVFIFFLVVMGVLSSHGMSSPLNEGDLRANLSEVKNRFRELSLIDGQRRRDKTGQYDAVLVRRTNAFIRAIFEEFPLLASPYQRLLSNGVSPGIVLYLMCQQNAEFSLEGLPEFFKELERIFQPLSDYNKYYHALFNDDVRLSWECPQHMNILHKLALEELMNKSREARSPGEIAAARQIHSLLKAKLGVRNVRFIDAESLILGMGFSEERTQELLNLPDDNLIDLFRNTSNFENDALKDRVCDDLRETISESRVAKDVVAALIARNESGPPPTAFLRHSGLHESRASWGASFLEGHNGGDKAISKIATIFLAFGGGDFVSFFANKRPSPTKESPAETILHECGHSITWLLFLELERARTLKLVPFLYPLGETLSQKIAFLASTGSSPPPSAVPEAVTQEKIIAGLTCRNASEMFQIEGVFFFKSILCINMLSDFSYRVERGLPVRSFHCGIPDSFFQRALALLFFSAFSIGEPMFRALFLAHGCTMDEYRERLARRLARR